MNFFYKTSFPFLATLTVDKERDMMIFKVSFGKLKIKPMT